MASGAGQQLQRGPVVATFLSLAGLLLVLSGLSMAVSLAGLAVAALLTWLLSTDAVVPGAFALGSLSLLPRLPLAASKRGDDVRVEQGKRRLGEVAAVAGERTPHAALAVVSKEGQGATDHKKPQDYEHYIAGPMVPNATDHI